jgi:hypothetical protein
VCGPPTFVNVTCACVCVCVRNKKNKFRPLVMPIRAAGEPAYSSGCGPLPRKGGHPWIRFMIGCVLCRNVVY